MKAIMMAVAGCGMLLAVAAAQGEAPHLQPVMKAIAGANGGLRKAVMEKDASQTEMNAKKLADAFEKVKAHFEEDHLTDGAKIAESGHHASMEVIAAAKAGDWDKASSELKTIGGSCQGCHTEYREKLPDGTYKMKHP